MNSGTSRILVVNGGSSSIKFALFDATRSMERVLAGTLGRIGQAQSSLRIEGALADDTSERALPATDHERAAGIVIDSLRAKGLAASVAAIGHRVVHGGPRFTAPQLLTEDLTAALWQLLPFAPEHMPVAMTLIDAFQDHFPALPHVACFDTAFHHGLPRVSQLLPIPRRYQQQGLRRYGFHGLSYEYLIGELARVAGPEAAQGRVVLAHLGHGASMTALRHGRPVDTSMGFTPASGLPMGTRSGNIDPGLAWYLAETERMSLEQFGQMLTEQSGLFGVSETSSDMRDLLAREREDPRAADAVALFCHHAKQSIAALAATVGGLDTLVFAGGIGENAPPIRARICEGLEFLGVALDLERNAERAPLISTPTGRVQVRVIPTDEEHVIARLVASLLERSAS